MPSRLFVVALLACVLAVAAGCASPEPSILVWHSYRGVSQEALERLARDYEARHGIRVELLALPFDAFLPKLDAAVPRDHGPDLFIDAHARLGAFLRDGLVAPAGDAFPDEDLTRYDAAATRAVTVRDERWAVPLEGKCLALYVNEDLVPATPDTLEGIVALRATLPPGVYPLAYEAGTPYYHVPFVHAFGGEMVDAEGHWAMKGDEVARSLDLVRELTRERAMPEEPSGALVKQFFSTGRAAVAINGPWMSGELGSDVHYRVEKLPRIAATGLPMRPYVTIDGAFLTPSGARRAEARAFARWLGSPEAAVVRATVGRQIVATEAAWDDPAVRGDTLLRAFHEAARDGVPMPTSTAMQAAWMPAQEAIRKALRGDMPALAALDEAEHRFDDALRPPPPPPSPAPVALALGVALLVGAFFALRRARDPAFRREVRASWPAYRYVIHAAAAVAVLVMLPLAAGALTSLFAGTREAPRYVGLSNYVEILTARGGPLLAHGSFYLTLLVTVAWTVANVALHVIIGLALGVALSRPLMRLRAAYRVLLILPWAVPSYVTALAWKGMFHRQFGAVNAILRALGADPVSWFSHFATAFAANVATNVWLGFPFMMVVTIGALTSIPKDVLEAAEVDGATRWQRFHRVTLPLLKPSILPAVVLGAVWTFNMFNVVFLVSGGEPDGTTDILVSEAYRWAFTRDAQYGYAAAYAVLIFILLAAGSRVLGKLGQGEEAVA